MAKTIAVEGKTVESSRKVEGKPATLRVSLTGSLRLEAGRVVDERRFPGRQARLLFVYFVCERARPIPRDELADLLWGESPPATWEKALTGVVGKLRSLLAECGALDPPTIVSAFGCYQLRLPEASWVDVEAAASSLSQADAAARQGELPATRGHAKRALDIARRPFLPGESAFWVEAKRRELDGVAVRALDLLTDASLDGGDAQSAVGWANEAVEREPLREAGYQRLMRAHVAADNQADALRAYERCRRLLAEELGAHPSPVTQALHRDILRGEGMAERVASTAREGGAQTAVVSHALPNVRRRGRTIAAVGGALLAAALTAGIVQIVGGSSSSEAPVANAVARIDGSTGRVTGYVELGGAPSNVAIATGRVWALDADRQSVTQIDARTQRVVGSFRTRGTPTDLAAGAGAVWVGIGATTPQGAVGTTYTASVSRVDPDSALVTHTVALHGPLITVASTTDEPFRLPGVSELAVGAGAVWAINPDRTVSRIDSRTGRLVARIPVVATHAIAAGTEGVWVVGKGPSVTRIDPRSNRAAQTIRLEATGLGGIAVGFGSVWATDPGDGLVWRIEPGPNPVTRSIDAGVGVTSISTAGGTVWATNFIDGHVLRIDPHTNAVTARIATAATPEAVVAGNNFAWVSVSREEDTAVLSSQTCGTIVSGKGHPDLLIASDLPLRGSQSAVTRSMADAIAFVLRRHAFRAGKYSVGYQSCDDSTAQTGNADFFTCAANARAYASTTKVVAVIGTYNSDCAQVEIPIADRAPGGPLAMISPSNTRQGLTRAGPGVERGSPGAHYPAGVRNYVRLAAPDDVVAAGAALLAKELALRSVYVLTTGTTAYGIQLANGLTKAAAELSVHLAGSATWDPGAKSYTALAGTIASSRADGVFLADFDLNGGALIRALRARLGRRLTLIMSDGFLPISSIVKEAGPAVRGGYILYPGAPIEKLGPAGRRFGRDFAETQPHGTIASGSYVPEAAAAAEVLLQAIARSDGSRASVLSELRRTQIKGGILGSFRFDANGDMTPALVSAFRVTGRKNDGKSLLSDFRGSQAYALVKVPTSLVPSHPS